MLGLAGGVLGVAVGYAGARLLPPLIDSPSRSRATSPSARSLIALAIGIGAGVYPATRAARLAPIDALRSE